MANYVYADTNTDLDLTFETESLGETVGPGQGSPAAEDYGTITGTPTNTLAATPLLAESSLDGDRGEIVNQNISPMGAIASMSSTTNEAFARTTYIGSGHIGASGASAPSLKRIWVGSGTLFEMGGGMERSSAFWVGSGGLTVAGTKEERVAGHYSDTLFVPFNSEDFGAGFATTSSFDVYGIITDPLDEGIDDYGFTYNTTDVRGASGILPLTNGPNAQGNTYAQSRKYIASGSLFSASGVVEATVAQPVEDTALFATSGSSVFRVTNDWVGAGNIALAGAGVDKLIVDYSIDSDLLLSDADYGTLEPRHEGYLQNLKFILGNAPYFQTPDNGEITEPLSEGEEDNGSIVFGQRRRTVHDIETVKAVSGKYTLGERKETGLRYQTRTLATGVPDLPINRYEWVGSGTMVGFRGEVFDVHKPIFGQAGSGSLFALGGAAESKTVDLPESTGLYQFQGHVFPETKLAHWTGSGSLFGFGGVVEAATFHYNISSTLPYSTEDYGAGFTTTSTEDIGLITEIQSGGEENWYYINHLGPATPFGPATFANGPDAQGNTYARVRPFIASGSLFSASGAAEAVSSNPPETTALVSFSGSGVEKSIFREVFSGSLFSVGGGVEKVTFDYNLSSINLFTTEDRDLVTNSASTNEDFGSTTEGIPQGAVDFDHIVFTQDAYGTTGGFTWSLTRSSWTQEEIDEKLFINPDYVTPETGLVPVAGVEQTQEESGDVSYIPIFGQVGEGSLFAIGGAAEAVAVSEETTGLFNVSGSTTFRAVVDYVASGSLFTLSGCVESATFDYNDSTVVTFTTDDQGLITATGSIVDYGSITNPLTAGIQNNGTVIHTTTVNAATGTYTFSDTATEKNIVREVFGGSLFSVGGAVEVAGVAEESTGLFATSGSSVFRVTNDWVGSGSLFALNGCAESATFDYNETTVVTFTTDDQGLITATGSIVDYGSITNPLTAGIANHGTVIHTSTVNAVTGTYTFSSTTTEKNVVREVFGGSLFSFGGAVEAATFDDPDSTLIATLSGHGIEKSVFREIMGGSLFSVGGGVEKVTFDYNLSSIVTYATPVDNGLISSATTTTADNGSIADPLTEGIDDLGTIIYSQTVEGTTGGVTFSYTRPSWTQAEIDDKLFINPDYVTPETGLVPVAGVEQTQEESGDVKYIPVFAQIGSGSLFAIGGAVEVAGVAEEATGLFRLFTSAASIGNTYRFCWNAPLVTGGLFSIGGCAESATWDYNESSIVTFSSEDNDLITNAVQTTADNGSITDPLTAGIQNNGTVIHTSTVYPVTGVLAVGSTTTFSKSNDYIGSGSISTFSGQALIEKAGVAEESTGLFSVSGSSVFRVTNDWVGSGSLFTFNGGVEKVTFDYNDTTIVTFSTDDQGLITATGSIVDYGSITNPLTAGIQNNGTVIHTSTVNAATGLIDLTGVGQTPRTRPFIGSGSLFTASGAAETVAFDEEFTGLFRLFTSAAGIGNTYRFCWNAPPVTGSLFSVGGGVEKVTFDYGDQVIFTSDDYGSITAPTNYLTDHFTNGLVAEPLSEGEEDYNTILYNQTVDAYDGGTGPVFTFGYQRAPLTQEDIDLLLFINPDYVTPETGLIPQVGDEATQEQSGDVKYEPAFAQIGSGSLFAVGGAAEAVAVVESTIGLFSVSGSSAYARTRPFIGGGSLFTLNGAAESATWDYNETSIVVFTSADYGNVTGTPSTGADYIDTGFVNETTTDGEINYGTVVNTSTVYPLTGSYVVSGDSADKKVAREIGGGTLSTFSGQALVEKVTFAEEATTLYDVVGTAVSTRARDFVGSGSLFTLNGCAEAVTWDYNEDSIDVFSSEDNGLISATATVLEDNGLITDPLTAGEENNGTVINTATTYPYGTIDLTGVAQTPRTRDFVGSGSLFTASGAVEVAVVDYESTYLFTVVGTTTFSRSRDFVGSGSLFSVGGGIEKVTFDYNDDTVLVYTGIDNGLITDTATTTADDGSISSPVSAGEESNGLIAFPNRTLRATTGTIQLGLTRDPLTQEDIDELLFINPDYVTPETGLIPQVGDEKTQEQARHVVYEPTFAMVGSGGLFTVGGAAEAVAVAESGTGLFALSTAPAFIGNTYRFCWKWDASGNLPIIGGAAESRTYDYNETTIVTFTTDDQGLITATGSIVDYGSITNPLTAGIQNNGTVINTSTVSAVTGTYTFSSTTTEKNVVREFSSGSLFAFGGAVEVVGVAEEATGLFSTSGSSVFRAVVDYVGSGSLFALNGCAESRTYDYSDELLQPFTQVDNGLISAATTTTDDNGNIILPTTAGEEDNGSILNTVITPAQGTYTTSGAAHVVRLPSYVGTGSLFTAGGLVEVVAQTDDTTGLFTVSGVADTIRSRAYVGTGTLNALSGVAESRTWVYDRDLPAVLTPEDYGSVDASATSNEDQGQVSNPLTTGEVDYGEDGTLAHLTDPAHGTYTISGVAETPFERRYIGSGSYGGFSGTAIDRFARFAIVDGFGTYTLFTSAAFIGNTYRFAFKFVGSGNLPLFGGAAESKTTNLPENTVLFTAAGTVSDTVTVREVFTGGTLSTFSGQALVEKAGVAEEATGLFDTGGTAVSTRARDFVGSGSLFTAGGAAESTTTNPPEDTVLFTVSGTTVERQTDNWVGSGSLFTASGAAEAAAVRTQEATGLFTVSGVGIEKHTERYVGTATAITLSGTAVEKATQDYTGDTAQYTLSGSAVERESNAEVASGSLFTAGGAAESKTSNPPESTVIFVVGGSKAESFTPATEIGSGTLSTFSGQSLIERVTVAEEDTTLYTISGQVVFNYVVSFVGSGSLFTAGGAAESKTTNKPESTVLFAASGTGAESATVREVFVGGTLSTFSGQALIERVAVAEEDTTLYTFSGAVEFIYRVRYPGSGTINLLSGAAEAAAVAEEFTGLYEFQGSKDESFTPAPYIGSGSYGGFSGTRVSEKHTEAYFGITQPYVVSGTGTVSQQYHWTGSGSLFTASGAAESKTTNLPESTVIFTVAGSIGTAKVTKDFVGSGSYGGFSGTCVERVAQADDIGGTITISGDVVFTVHYLPVVGGNLFTVGGAAERVAFNPPEDTYLLVFGGSKAESFSPTGEVGFGTATLSGTRVSEKHTERYVGDSAQFTYSGEATNVRFIPNWVGSGSIYLTGDGDTTRARDFVGSGSLFTAGGLAEAVTTNAPESTVLFTAAGQSVERHTESYVGSGSATLSGEATDIKVIRYFDGSGSLFTFSGAAESATFVETAIGLYGIGGFGAEAFVAQPPEDTAQYTFSGNAVEEQLDHYTGSGVMDFLEGGAAVVFAEEKITFSPDGFGLFTFSGTSTSAVNRPYIGSGNISTFSGQAIDEKVTFADDETLQVQLSGESVSKFTGSFLGSGSLFTASGAAESTTTNPPEDTVLFTVSGTAQTPRARDFVGSGSIVITGSAEERTVQPHVGTGSLFAVGGAAEAVAFADADTLIARFSGGANESFIRSGYQATGSATLSGTSEEKHTERYVGDTAQYTISGGATEVRFVPHFNGSGSLFTASGAAESKTTNIPESTVLFTFSGEGKERLVNSRHTGSGTITLSGDATTEYRKFEVGFTFVTII